MFEPPSGPGLGVYRAWGLVTLFQRCNGCGTAFIPKRPWVKVTCHSRVSENIAYNVILEDTQNSSKTLIKKERGSKIVFDGIKTIKDADAVWVLGTLDARK